MQSIRPPRRPALRPTTVRGACTADAPEARPDVGEVDAGDEAHPAFRGGDGLAERVEEARHPRIRFRLSARPDRLVKERGEERQDGKGPAPQQAAEHHGLELDRVLAAMSRLRGEQIMAVAPVERLEEIPVGLSRPERRVIGLERRGERILHPRVAGAEDDEEVRVRPLQQGAIGPGIGRPAPMEVDVRSDEAAELLLSRSRHRKPRSLGVEEEAVDLPFQRLRVARVRAPAAEDVVRKAGWLKA